MTSQAQAQAPLPGVRGLVFLGFPLHPPGRPGVARAEHLASVKVPMPDGAVILKVPPGSTKERTMRLKGRGIPGMPNGDLHAVLKIVLPPASTDKAKELYRDMEREMPFNPRADLGV